jgi:hypothetical protein
VITDSDDEEPSFDLDSSEVDFEVDIIPYNLMINLDSDAPNMLLPWPWPIVADPIHNGFALDGEQHIWISNRVEIWEQPCQDEIDEIFRRSNCDGRRR